MCEGTWGSWHVHGRSGFRRGHRVPRQGQAPRVAQGSGTLGKGVPARQNHQVAGDGIIISATIPPGGGAAMAVGSVEGRSRR